MSKFSFNFKLIIFFLTWINLVPSSLFFVQGDEGINYRLPNDTRPSHYDIYLSTNIHLEDEKDPEKFIFHGFVKIHIDILETTKVITLHAFDIRNVSAYLLNENNEKVPYLYYDYDGFTEFLMFYFEKFLYREQKFILVIEYESSLRPAQDNAGFYRSSYDDSDGKRHWLAVTQFQMIDARHAFPCYDEPQIRATFSLTIDHDRSLAAVSNMPVRDRIESSNGRVTTIFQKTPSMQTYLLAFLVSDFGDISVEEPRRNYRLWGRKEKLIQKEGDFGLIAGVNILKYQEQYFNTSFSLPKLDQAAIPDFLTGAMENWGLVNYEEKNLFYNPKTSPLSDKHKIVELIAHEMAHQFFGNLIAPKWWTYYWLNEGFATLYQYGLVIGAYPEYTRDWDYFVVVSLHLSLDLDATEDTRPMTLYVNDPRDLFINSWHVHYHKAGSVLRMFQEALGEETFRKGVQYYLREMQFKAAGSDDLARGLEKAAIEDGKLPENYQIKDIIDSWALKKHYPVVNVQIGRNNRVQLSQQQFKYEIEESNDIWIIPVTIATEDNPDFEHTEPVTWFGTETLTLPAEWTADGWVVLNLQATGHYRVNYDAELWSRLIEKLLSPTFDDIHYLNRGQLVDDAFALARAGVISYKLALQVTEYLEQEDEFVPWTTADRGFSYINRLLVDSESYSNLKLFINDMVAPLFKSLGIEDGGENEPLPYKTARTISINWACLAGNVNCNRNTTELIREAGRNTTEEISPDLQYPIYCNGLRYTSTEDFVPIYQKMQRSTDQGFRSTLIRALGCSQDSESQKIFLEDSLETDPEKVNYRSTERPLVLRSVYANGGKTGVESAIAFIKERYEDIGVVYGSSYQTKTAARGIASYVTSPRMLELYDEALQVLEDEKVITAGERASYLARSQLNIDWVEANEAEILEFLNEYLAKPKKFHQ